MKWNLYLGRRGILYTSIEETHRTKKMTKPHETSILKKKERNNHTRLSINPPNNSLSTPLRTISNTYTIPYKVHTPLQ